MPVNAGYEYANAEKLYFRAETLDEKIAALEELIRAAPKHKSSEKLVSELKNRLRRFIEKKEKNKKVGKTTQKSIRKEGFQCVIIGLTNSGKSSLLAKLTNAKPKISPYAFTTSQPEVGTLDFKGYKAQIIDLPAIGSENFDIGMVNTADCLLIVLENLSDLDKITEHIKKSRGKSIIALNKADLLSAEEIRKLYDKIRSKKLNATITSCINDLGIEEIKEQIIKNMPLIRVYTKEPGKPSTGIPMILKTDSTVKQAAESIYKGFSLKVKETRVSGPSSKFANQKVGLSHVLKDLDTIEFHTK
jgi:hypothetical protein